MLSFQYHPDILARFPDLAGGIILAGGLVNGPSPAALQSAFAAEQRRVLSQVGERPLSELPTLAAWRSAFRGFGVNPTKYRSAAEALLRRLVKKGDIPSINVLVDLCNLASIRYALPVAAFDVKDLRGGITVRFAGGQERFTPLGESAPEQPEPGEVIFADESGLVVARRWCWRQSAESAAGLETRQAIFTIEAQHPGGAAQVQAALDDLLSLLEEYSGGRFKHAVLAVTGVQKIEA